MILRALETGALYEGNAQRGFGVSILDGSPMPLGLKATNETTGISKTLWGRWKPLMPQDQTLWVRSKATQTN